MYRTIYKILTNEHGFGFCYAQTGTGGDVYSAYFEDDAFAEIHKNDAIEVLDQEIDRISGWGLESRYWGISRKDEEILKTICGQGSVSFQRAKEDSIEILVSWGKEQARIVVRGEDYRYYRDYRGTCSCGRRECVHMRAAGLFYRNRDRKLQHQYITTQQPVNKGLFVEDRVRESINDGCPSKWDPESVEKARSLVRMVDEARSGDYYRAFHSFLLALSPYEYDSHFLEDYTTLLLALFEDAGYYDAVIRPGGYADPGEYEGRQRRSNRTCFKRIRKDYEKAVRELDIKGNYAEDYVKEFVLKYRRDYKGLARYYAEGKTELEEEDLEYLDKIAGDPEIAPEPLGMAARKLDRLAENGGTQRVFRRLVERLPHEEMVQVYQDVRNISMSADMIKGLDRQDQLALIDNTPLNKETFLYIMNDLLADQEDAARGAFILRVLKKIIWSMDQELKQAVMEEAGRLADSRLLLAYLELRLRSRVNGLRVQKGDPEKEITTYFDCRYEIQNVQSRYSAWFKVLDPADPDWVLMDVEEEKGKKTVHRSLFHSFPYPDDLIKTLCLRGKEEVYEREMQENQDAVDAYHFEKEHKKFAAEYRKLCESLLEEKIIFHAAQKAQIEWMIYREEKENVLAFRVGNTRMYVVRDAAAFIEAFKTGQTIEYGKDLILTHDVDNLNETDAAVIKLLMASRYTKGRKNDKNNKRYLTVSDGLMGNLIEQLKDRTVLYNETPCLIRLDARQARLKINDRYELSTGFSPKEQFLNFLGKGYLISPQRGEIPLAMDRLEGSSEEIGLIELVDQNPSVSVKPILKNFRKNIYNRFFERFDVDPKVQKDFRLSEIRLQVYFDYEKSVVTVKVKILKDDRELRADQLSDRIDLVKYELLENYLNELGFSDGRMEDESRILSFFKMDFTRLKSMANVYLSDNLQNKELKTVGKPVVRVSYKNNILQAFLEKSEYTEDELARILAGIRKKKKFILLDGNRIIDLDNEAARDLGDTVKDLELNPKDLYEKKRISMVTAIKAFAHEKSCRVDKYLRDMIDEIRSYKEAEIAPPKLNAQLREYQTEGFKWLSILTKYGMGGILADDMGLGKTIQVIALIRADRTRKPSLIVCPKSLVFNWVNEFARFDGKTEVVEIYGTDSARSARISAIDYGKKTVYVTSYDSLRNDIAKYTGAFHYGILDEAQYIKNVHAQKTKSVKELNVHHRFALTGTPIENSVVDLWSIFDYLMPGYFEELSQFKDSDTAAIARKAGPFILRRVKEDVLEELPMKYERILSADMSDGQRKIYDAMRLEARQRMDEGGKAFDMLPYLTRLRQVCVDPGMFVENYTGGSGKMEMLESLIPEYLQEGHRILVFSQFVKALEAVNRMLKEKGIPTFFLVGATSAKDRMEMMDSFNNGSGTDVFLISLKAGGTGLNLIGADTVIHLDPWWNVAAENQASDRTHRIGQKRNVEVIKLIAGSSIEQRVVELQDKKKEVISQVISDDDGAVTSASMEDIAFVLG